LCHAIDVDVEQAREVREDELPLLWRLCGSEEVLAYLRNSICVPALRHQNVRKRNAAHTSVPVLTCLDDDLVGVLEEELAPHRALGLLCLELLLPFLVYEDRDRWSGQWRRGCGVESGPVDSIKEAMRLEVCVVCAQRYSGMLSDQIGSPSPWQ
jgi:hypothetical protein